MDVLAFYNGLDLLVDDEVNFKFLVNLITSHQIKIIDSSLVLERPHSFTICELGYDKTNNDYKIVVLPYLTGSQYYSFDVDTFVDVCYVKRGYEVVW